MRNPRLRFYYGTMSSGKSLHLLATAHNFEERGIPILVLKSSIDTRDGENVVFSRALGKRKCITITPSTDIFSFIRENYVQGKQIPQWILVDEAQFLTEKQVDQLAAIVDEFQIHVSCYGLRTDFRTNLFPGSKRLFEVADTIEEMKSSCDCGDKTIFNARIDKDGKVVTDGEQIEVGGDDRYIALCRKCYFEKTYNPLYIKN